MEYKYYRDEGAYHFYRIGAKGEKILHVHYSRDSRVAITKTEHTEIKTPIFAGSCLINNIEEVRDKKLVEIPKEKFDETIREVIFILGIYDYTRSLSSAG